MNDVNDEMVVREPAVVSDVAYVMSNGMSDFFRNLSMSAHLESQDVVKVVETVMKWTTVIILGSKGINAFVKLI